MASTFSTRLKIELIGDGEQAGSWGTTTNNNFNQSIEQAIAGVLTVATTGTGTTTLTTGNGPQAQADAELPPAEGAPLARARATQCPRHENTRSAAAQFVKAFKR